MNRVLKNNYMLHYMRRVLVMRGDRLDLCLIGTSEL